MKKLKILSFIIIILSVVTIFIVGKFDDFNNRETLEKIGQVENAIQEDNAEDEEFNNQEESQEIVEQEIIQDNNSTKQEAITQTNMQQDTKIKETKPSNPAKQNSNTKQANTVQNVSTQKNTPTTQVQPQEQTQLQKQEQPTKQTSSFTNNKETFKINNSIINKMKSIINSNPSTFMKQFGYNIVVDSSIVNKTTGFTYTETRVKNAIANSFGTISIYAQDYYVGNELRWTESFIL